MVYCSHIKNIFKSHFRILMILKSYKIKVLIAHAWEPLSIACENVLIDLKNTCTIFDSVRNFCITNTSISDVHTAHVWMPVTVTC